MNAEQGAERYPLLWENWSRFERGVEPDGAWEFAVYSDANVVGEALQGIGPYKLINALGFGWKPSPQAASLKVVVRAEDCIPEHVVDPAVHDASTYHGADVMEEMAAVLSLALGVRFRSGGQVRNFEKDGDPRGQPQEFSHITPYLPPPKSRTPTIPSVLGRADLGSAVEWLVRFASLPGPDALAVLRAARQYQDAIWIAESDPGQTWIRLVSALEVAAIHSGPAALSAVDELTSAVPDVAQWLRDNCADGLDVVATSLRGRLGATGRFVKFVTNRVPAAPKVRHEGDSRVTWSKTQLKGAVSKVYDYRSKALHAGTPFPAPMTWAPMFDPPEERPPGHGAGAGRDSWSREDLPLSLHTFEYIARGVLLAWWAELASEVSTP